MPIDLLNLKLSKKTVYYMIYKGVNLGYFTPDTLAINGELQSTPFEVDQIKNPEARVDYDSIIPTIDVTIANDSLALLYQGLLGDMAGFRPGTAGAAYGWGDIDEDASIHAGLLEIIPVANFDAGNRLESFMIPKAYLPAQTIALLKGKGRFGTVPIQFKALADEDAPKKFRYLWHGNLDAENIAPEGIFITATRRPRPEPAVGIPSIGVAGGTFDRLTAWLFYSQDSANTSDVAVIVAAGDTTITFDTQVGRQFVIGDVIKIGTEYMYVSAVDAGAGTIDVVRNYGSAIAAPIGHAIDDTITIQSEIYFWIGTNIVAWSSAAPGTVSVGDIVGADDATEKGRITNVSADNATAAITASLLAKTSNTVTATAAAIV